VAATSSVEIKGIQIPTSKHPEVIKLKKSNNVHSMHGNKVWNSSLVLIDALNQYDIVNTKVADLGCGWGALSCYLQKQGAKVTGYDSDISVKPYFELMSKLMDVNPKFVHKDIFDEDLPMTFDSYVACDVCFWDKHIEHWITLIEELAYNNKQLLMCDPGRETFWKLLENCQVPHTVQRQFIKKPRETDSYIVIFGS
jgi:predicted nicotinamide N-methyase|tara:strand:- start:6152 stop:6742 length:591 start_codon:yes stop_codon:yes gene_type:complete